MKLEELDLYLTNKCNLSCDFCSVEARKCSEELSLDRIKEIILEAKEFGLEELHLTGGEPTLRPDLEDVIKFAVSQGLNVRLITNGTTLSIERLKNLYQCGLRSIMLSLDGTKEYHDNVRGKGSFEKTMITVRDAISLSMLVRVNSVAWKDNQTDIIQLARLLNDIGVDVYSVFLGSPLGYAKTHKHNVISPAEWRLFCDDLKSFVDEHKIEMKVVIEKGFLFSDEINFDVSGFQGRGRGCHDITEYCDFLLIRSNGDMYPCVFFSNEAPPIGNVNRQSLRDLLERYPNDEFYREIGKYPEHCEQCKDVEKCKGGCRGYAKLYTNKWMVNDPRCKDGVGDIIPLCPIVKYNLNEGRLGGSSEQVLR